MRKSFSEICREISNWCFQFLLVLIGLWACFWIFGMLINMKGK